MLFICLVVVCKDMKRMVVRDDGCSSAVLFDLSSAVRSNVPDAGATLKVLELEK